MTKMEEYYDEMLQEAGAEADSDLIPHMRSTLSFNSLPLDNHQNMVWKDLKVEQLLSRRIGNRPETQVPPSPLQLLKKKLDEAREAY